MAASNAREAHASGYLASFDRERLRAAVASAGDGGRRRLSRLIASASRRHPAPRSPRHRSRSPPSRHGRPIRRPLSPAPHAAEHRRREHRSRARSSNAPLPSRRSRQPRASARCRPRRRRAPRMAEPPRSASRQGVPPPKNALRRTWPPRSRASAAPATPPRSAKHPSPPRGPTRQRRPRPPTRRRLPRRMRSNPNRPEVAARLARSRTAGAHSLDHRHLHASGPHALTRAQRRRPPWRLHGARRTRAVAPPLISTAIPGLELVAARPTVHAARAVQSRDRGHMAEPAPKKPAPKKLAPKKLASKKLNYRLPAMSEETLDAEQRALLELMRAGPRGGRVQLGDRSASTCWRRNTAS